MKFDYCIGNPPYQDSTLGNNDTFAPPVYDKFLDAAYAVADKVEMIHPARFLFDAGSTPKSWNKKMLNDEHFKVLAYEPKSSTVFSNTDIKGGIAITYRNTTQKYGAIEIFTPFPDLNSILKKAVTHCTYTSLAQIIESAYAYHFTPSLYTENPHLLGRLSKGHDYDLKSPAFDLLTEIFFDTLPANGYEYVQILGRQNNQRTFKWIRRDYVAGPKNFEKYKVFLAGANGCGAIGEVLSTPLVGTPLVGNTESFISFGSFDTEQEANACMQYIKTRFARALLGVLKVTQAITPAKWKYVPMQDFTSDSDIDWSVPVAAIDKQLYKKYDLTQAEIDFIETHVKEMV